MIQKFSDHAANERTFLAWVRTAIAIMAFGFLVARFNLILRISAQSPTVGGAQPAAAGARGFGELAGLMLIAAGLVIVTVATIRFIRTGRAIDSPELYFSGVKTDLLLAALMLIMGIALVIYLSATLMVSL